MTRRTPTFNRFSATLAGALLALGGLGVSTAPAAHASTANYGSVCAGRIGDTIHASSDYPVGCTVPSFGSPWDPNRTQTQTSTITVTNHADYAVRIITTDDGGSNGTAPGDVTGRVEVPYGGIELPGHDSVQVPVSITFYGPFTSDVQPAGHGIPVSTVPVTFGFRVTGPWSTFDSMFASANYPVVNSGGSGGGGSSSPPANRPQASLAPLAVAGNSEGSPGEADPLWISNMSSRPEWLTLCSPTGRPVASGRRSPGGMIEHAVAVPRSGSAEYDAYAGSSPARCSGAERSFVVSAGAWQPVENTHIFAAASTAPVGSSVPIFVADTTPNRTWVTLCEGGEGGEGGRALASGWKVPGTAGVEGRPVEHDVTSGTAGTVSYTAHQGKASCSGDVEGSASITWTS